MTRRVPVWLLICWLLAACKDRADASKPMGSAAAATAASSAVSSSAVQAPAPPARASGNVADPLAQTAHEGSWTLLDAQGGTLARLAVVGEVATIEYGTHVLKSTLRSGSRRYHLDGATAYLAKVKMRGPSINLRSPAEPSAWSAALSADKVMLNEAGRTRFTLFSRAAEFQLESQGQSLGHVRYDQASKRVEVFDPSGSLRFTGSGPGASAMWLVPLIDAIPEAQRYIFMAELGARGR